MKTDLFYDNFLIFDLSDLLNLVTVGAKYNTKHKVYGAASYLCYEFFPYEGLPRS